MLLGIRKFTKEMAVVTSILLVLLLGGASVTNAATLTFTVESELAGSTQTHELTAGHKVKDHKVYLFVADGKKKPYSYVNEFGKLVGFDVDIVDEVCKIAGKRCSTVLAQFTECIFTDRGIDYAGRGLMAEWFDGCPGYQITPDRENEFDFTLPYLNSSSSFTVAPGNPSGFDPDSDDYSSFNLLHLTGAPTNQECLRRLHKKFGNILIAQDLPEAKALLLNRSADVLFSPREVIADLEVLPQRVQCGQVGAGIMLKKGSSVPAWWNPAFLKFFKSGKYAQLCQGAQVKYGNTVKCLPSNDNLSSELYTLFNKPQSRVPEKLWKFVVSGRIQPFSFLNDEGYLEGFTKDMLDAVCKIAGKSCVLLLAPVPECSVRIGELLYPGRGLMEEWFDACTGYFETQDRDNSWDFTFPYLLSNGSFYVAFGNPRSFDPDSKDYSAFTIVYQATAITNSHCLNRLHKKFGKLVVVEDKQAAIQTVLDGNADVWFTKEDEVTELERLPQRVHCEHVGTSIMAKKGSQLPGWWNPAFDQFYSSGAYDRFCTDQGKKYNYTFPCITDPPTS